METLFQDTLLTWFEEHHRDLPWRNTKDAYAIWLSEIILQQTRVAQGLPYYEKFITQYPTVKELALAEDDAVMKLWEGLGYYSRARNMLATARYIHEHCEDIFPHSFATLKLLKGIGDYTAAAIASFAFDEAVAVVDGNVQRVLSRYLGIEDDIKHKKIFQQYADTMLNLVYPAAHNQAIMEFGALQCVPKNPMCHMCVLQPTCYAYREDKVAQLPVKAKKAPKPTKKALFYYIENEFEEILIRKRPQKGIWSNLYEIPNHEIEETPFEWLPTQKPYKTGSLKHIFTHFTLEITFYALRTPFFEAPPTWQWTNPTNRKNRAFPKAILKIFDAIQIATLF